MAKVPEWAKQWNRKGCTIQSQPDGQYLYAVKSRRVKGVKYPVVDRAYVGVVTPGGVVVKVDVNIDRGDIAVHEAGFTDAVLTAVRPGDLAPSLGEGRQGELVRAIILRNSPRSYLWGECASLRGAFTEQQLGMYERRLWHRLGVGPGEMGCLFDVHLLVFSDGLRVRSRMDDEQIALYERIGARLPWDAKERISSDGRTWRARA